MRISRAAITALLGLILTTTLLTTSAQADGEMSTARAGKYYLKTICPEDAAQRRFNAQVFKGRNTITVAEVRGRLPELRELSRPLGQALQAEARHMYNPPAPWPADVAGLTDKFATLTARDATNLGGMTYATTAAEWDKYNSRFVNNSFGSLPTVIRARLDLPAPGKGC